MNFDYTLKFDLPLDEAWATLMDIERIAPCMPGAKIESRDGDTYTGRLKVKLGPMEMTYRGNIQFVERDDAAKRAVVDAQAKEIKGRGEAKTQVTMTGSETGDGSEINIASEFSVSGKAAQFGRGVMEEVGEKLMDDFASRLGSQIESAAPAAPAASDSAATTTDPSVVPDAQPAAAEALPTTPAADDDDALDLGEAVGGSVLKRLAIPGLVIAAVLVAWWLL